MGMSTLGSTSSNANSFENFILQTGGIQRFIEKVENYLANGSLPDVLVFDFRENSTCQKDTLQDLYSTSHEVVKASTLMDDTEEMLEAKKQAPHITTREKDVLELISKGLTYNEIAALLTMSTHTVTSHIKNIYRKLSVHSRGEASFEARQLGIIQN